MPISQVLDGSNQLWWVVSVHNLNIIFWPRYRVCKSFNTKAACSPLKPSSTFFLMMTWSPMMWSPHVSVSGHPSCELVEPSFLLFGRFCKMGSSGSVCIDAGHEDPLPYDFGCTPVGHRLRLAHPTDLSPVQHLEQLLGSTARSALRAASSGACPSETVLLDRPCKCHPRQGHDRRSWVGRLCHQDVPGSVFHWQAKRSYTLDLHIWYL